LEKDDIIEIYKKQKGLCLLTKDKLGYQKSSNLAMSFDRINCDKGYTKYNIQLVTELANAIRSDLPIIEFREICNKIIENK
jgi:hypothetical protein